MNGGIRAKEVRVIAPDGEQIGIKSIQEAMWLANQLELDLVEVAPDARPPVTKIMDYGKFKYEQSVRDREARKNQTRTVIKEVRLRPSTGEHDYQMVRRRAEDFLMHGDKVKVTIRFRGRENERPELGRNLVDRLVSEIGDIVTVEQSPRKEGRQMHAVLAPNAAAIKRRKEEAEADEAEADESQPVEADADEVRADTGEADEARAADDASDDLETAPADEEE
ncbi:MAG: translation initiation factor IF-3 [Acidimicrobiia bacterium]